MLAITRLPVLEQQTLTMRMVQEMEQSDLAQYVGCTDLPRLAIGRLTVIGL